MRKPKACFPLRGRLEGELKAEIQRLFALPQFLIPSFCPEQLGVARRLGVTSCTESYSRKPATQLKEGGSSLSRKVKVGFVGAGYMGQIAHLVNYVNSPRCEVVAIAEMRESLGRAVAERYRIPKVYRSHRELAEDPDVEAVVAILPYTLNAPVALDLLAAGKHVFIEKPMTTSLALAEKMHEAAARAGKILQIGYMKRYDPGVELAKETISSMMASGELGPVTFARLHCFGGDWICGAPDPIRAPSGDMGDSDVEHTRPAEWLPASSWDTFHWLNNVWCHNINLMRYLLPGPVEVSFAGKLKRQGDVIVLDVGGVPCSLEIGGISARRWDEETQVYFADGWVKIGTPPPLLRNVPAEVEIYRAGSFQEIRKPLASWGWAFQREAEAFLNSVLTGEEPKASSRDALEDVRIIEAIMAKHLASKEGAPA